MLVSEQNLRDISKSLQKLEGVSVGLSPFYSKLSWYMNQQIDAIYRIFREMETPFQKLDGHSREGWEEIDKEALDDPETLSPSDPFPKKTLRRRIRDRKLGAKLDESKES